MALTIILRPKDTLIPVEDTATLRMGAIESIL